MRIRLFAACILFTTVAFAQRNEMFDVGFIIRPDSSVKAGYVQRLDSLPSNACWFKDSLNSKAQRFEPTQIIGYGFFRGKTFISFRTRDRVWLFFEKLNDGNVKVYKALSLFLIQRGTARPVQLTLSEYKSTLENLLTDCPFVRRKLSAVTLEKKRLVWIVNQYNACASDPSTFKGTGYVKTEVGLYATVTSVSAKMSFNPDFSYLSNATIMNHRPISFGFQAWFTRPYLSKTLALRAGAMYNAQSFTLTGAKGTERAEENISLNEIQAPVSVQLLLGARKNLFVRAGASMSIVTNVTSYLHVDTTTGSGIYQDETIPVSSVQKSPQVLLGIGYQVRLSDRYKIVVEGTYANGKGKFTNASTSSNIDASFQSFSFTTGFVFQ